MRDTEEVKDFFTKKLGKYEELRCDYTIGAVIAALEWGTTPFYGLVLKNLDEEGRKLLAEWLALFQRIRDYVEQNSISAIPSVETSLKTSAAVNILSKVTTADGNVVG